MRENCIVCGKEIYRSKSQRPLKESRPPKALTCSKECSKVYTRIFNYLYMKIKKSLEK